jgi:hypothetical protein
MMQAPHENSGKSVEFKDTGASKQLSVIKTTEVTAFLIFGHAEFQLNFILDDEGLPLYSFRPWPHEDLKPSTGRGFKHEYSAKYHAIEMSIKSSKVCLSLLP